MPQESFIQAIFSTTSGQNHSLVMAKDCAGWDSLSNNRQERVDRADELHQRGTKIVNRDHTVQLLERVIEPGDKVILEGNNQKQADFLARCLNKVDPQKIHNLHMIQASLSLPEHLDVFEKKIASKVDFCYSGPVANRMAQMMQEKKINVGAIHTYLELYARFFSDLTPRVSLVAADYADPQGNLYTGYSTEDTPVIVEATHFRQGIVIAQVNEIRHNLPRVDIPGDWVDYVIEADQPYYLEPLFTRDPALINERHILTAMLALKGVYARYGVKRLNHGVGFGTAAIELLLPTYGEQLGLKGKTCKNFLLNPHPTLIPAIESGFVKSIYSPGGELGMEKYVCARSDIFFVGPDGFMRPNRHFAQTTGHYGVDMFIGASLQIDPYGNTSTVTNDRVTGFGGASNMGCDALGRRHANDTWLQVGREFGMKEQILGNSPRGKKLVVQLVETFGEKCKPTFVEKLDAWQAAENTGLPLPPVMIYGSDVTHIISEEGIANLNMCHSLAERMSAIRAIAGYTPLGLKAKESETKILRASGIVQYPEDLGIDRDKADRSLLAAKNIRELVNWSKGLYEPPVKFRNW